MRILLIALFALFALEPGNAQVAWWKWPKRWAGSKFHNAKVDRKAPPNLGQTLEGEGRTIRDYEGKVLFLNFWTVWCPPCLEELSHLPELQVAFKDEDFEVLAIHVLGKKEKLLRYLESHSIDLNFLHDAGDKVAKAYGIIRLPTALLVDDEDIILKRWEGADLEEVKKELANYFEERQR